MVVVLVGFVVVVVVGLVVVVVLTGGPVVVVTGALDGGVLVLDVVGPVMSVSLVPV